MSSSSTTLAKSLLFLRALTPIHAGMGRGTLEHVDLPIQRDEFGFPTIWASSLKGSLRGNLRRYVPKTQQELECFKSYYRAAFGPEPGFREEMFPAAISLFDARLLFLPARSLKGIWVYVTSPHLISYLNTYAEIVGRSPVGLKGVVTPLTSRDEILLENSKAILNELDIVNMKVSKNIVDNLFGKILPSNILSRIKSKGLVIVDDDTMSVISRRSMLIQYRVRLKHPAKVVVPGALWSEEYLPQETILVSGIICRPLTKAVSEKCGKKYESICEWLKEKLQEIGGVIWLGGKETIGKGVIKLYMV
ncbi:MAG: type III-B CRISPR module RAMP protein Cmr4 [Desulfurococcales archaeon ex4484_217_2]|nr:MAG: type III-B CRISPR module RAMP protein Cmr4 [Desulfurococcales archaeon ex4484_217_2]